MLLFDQFSKSAHLVLKFQGSFFLVNELLLNLFILVLKLRLSQALLLLSFLHFYSLLGITLNIDGWETHDFETDSAVFVSDSFLEQ